jgi:hypothetical protein
MAKRKKPPRSWTIDDLLDLGRKQGEKGRYLKAVPVLILEKWVSEGREEEVANYAYTKPLARRLEKCELVTPFKPKATGGIFGSLTSSQKSRNLIPPLIEYRGEGMSWINLPHYEPLLQQYRQEYSKLYLEDYEKLFPEGEPEWEPQGVPVQKSPDVQPKSLKILQVLQDYEMSWKEKLQEAENRAITTERENRELLEKLSQSNSALSEITDEILKKRIGTLLDSPLDTMIREAGVVLEDRLREVGKAGYDLEGVKLVDALLSPKKGTLVFSSHSGEQDGVRMLYRGAMQFIRNPPMHKLIEYPENTARLLIRLVDSLLQLLSEAELRQSD